MKIYLDDERQAPIDWIQCRWPDEVIEYLQTGKVTEISLDHDLGWILLDVREDRGWKDIPTGYDVLLWLEEAVFNGFKPVPVIHIHTANSSARKKMELAVEAIYKLSSK